MSYPGYRPTFIDPATVETTTRTAKDRAEVELFVALGHIETEGDGMQRGLVFSQHGDVARLDTWSTEYLDVLQRGHVGRCRSCGVLHFQRGRYCVACSAEDTRQEVRHAA